MHKNAEVFLEKIAQNKKLRRKFFQLYYDQDLQGIIDLSKEEKAPCSIEELKETFYYWLSHQPEEATTELSQVSLDIEKLNTQLK